MLVLAFFVTSGRWYEETELVIEGTAAQTDQFSVQWDSGNGYNEYEKESFAFFDRLSRATEPLPVSIRYIKEKNGASLSREFVLRQVSIDGLSQNLSAFCSEKDDNHRTQGLRLDRHCPEVVFNALIRSGLEIELLTNNHSGIAGLFIGAEYYKKDLYMANIEAKTQVYKYWFLDNDHFSVRVKVPRYRIENFKISHANAGDQFLIRSIMLEEKGTLSPVQFQTRGNTTTFFFQHVRPHHYWKSMQGGFQVVFSLLTTWMVYALIRQWRRVGGIKALFSGQRKVFWLFGFGAAGAFFLWLLPFWPGVMSIDSLKIWRAALLPEVFLNDHPLFNVVLYTYLSQLWHNPAIVPLFHIVMISLLTAYVFASIHSKGVPIVWLLPFYLLLITSLPVSLYNIVLWKDIPFALLIIYWGYTLIELYLEKREGTLSLSLEKKLVLLLLLLALALTRHNGLIYLFVVPLYFFCLGLVDRKRFFWVTVAGMAGIVALLFVLQKSEKAADASFFFAHTYSYLQEVFSGNIGEAVQRVWNNYWGILNVNQTVYGWDLWHYFLGDRTAYWFLRHAQWNDVYPFLGQANSVASGLKEIFMYLYWKSYEAPWVYVTWNPLHVLALMPVTVLCFRRTPLAAILSSFILIQVLALLVITNIMNWRYYYYVCLGGLFLGPVLLLDFQRWRAGRARMKGHCQ